MAFPKATYVTFRENWPQEVAALAIPAKTIPLSLEDVAAIGWHTPDFRDATGLASPRSLSDGFRQVAAETLGGLPMGAFPRLGYCSWKASTPVAVPLFNEKELAAIVNQPDPRIATGLLEAIITGQSLPLHLVEWRDMDRGLELRVFIRRRRFAGASQYHLSGEASPSEGFDSLSIGALSAEWLGIEAKEIENAAKGFTLKLCDVLPIDSVVADVLVTPQDNALTVELIELNPATRQTDSGLFSWDRVDFDQTLRLAAGTLRQS